MVDNGGHEGGSGFYLKIDESKPAHVGIHNKKEFENLLPKLLCERERVFKCLIQQFWENNVKTIQELDSYKYFVFIKTLFEYVYVLHQTKRQRFIGFEKSN